MVYDGGDNSKREIDGGGISGEDIYKGRTESVLVSPSDPYSELDSISISIISRFSSCPILHYLTTYCQDYRKWTLFLFIFFLIFIFLVDLFFIFSIFRTLGLGLEVISHISHI